MRYLYEIWYRYKVNSSICEKKLRTSFDTPEKEGEFFVNLEKPEFSKFRLNEYLTF